MTSRASDTTTVLRGRVVAPARTIPDGVVVLDGDTIAHVGPADSSPVPPPPPSAATVLPGLVDVHCHGGGGAGFPDATSEDEARLAVREHLAHGTTTLVASLVTAAPETLLERSALLAGLADAGDLAGIHLEGPFLSRERRGAQDPGLMIDGSADLVREVARVSRGHLVTMTVAPETPGVLGPGGVVEALAEVGAVPSFGHSDTSARLTREAIAEAREALARYGARSLRPTATHLFNGMRPWHHREPGPVAALLAAAGRGDAVVELVGDGTHLDPETVRAVADLTAHADGVILVTDAMAAAGMPDGAYRLGTADVVVAGGVARLASDGAIAGGTAHLLDVLRHTVAAGVDVVTAVRMASLVPAGVLGRTDVGRLEAGARADVLVTDDDLRPRAVLRGGLWVVGEPAGQAS